MSPVNYVLSEGTLPLPEAVQDQSITLLRLPGVRATLVVTRAWEVKAGQEEAYLQQQLAKVKRDMNRFTADEAEDTLFGGLPAREVNMRFENQGVQVVQKLLVVMTATHLMALTFSRTARFDPAALQVWQAIKDGFMPAAGLEA
ncbi:DcrB-related protein [Erwinia endophytica]|uniref:DcrB-related protein n=1 Tax=Erwinia endophytica TaxID=1563158 RepID=UPI00186B5E91|nr:DcrB-related protein [Erwinia endophytica]